MPTRTFQLDTRPSLTSRLISILVSGFKTLEHSLIASGEQSISAPELAAKIKRGARGAVESEIAKALEKLEQEDATADELKKAQLGVKRAM